MVSTPIILGLPLIYLALQIAALGWMAAPWRAAAAWPAVAMGGALILYPVGIVLNAPIASALLALALPLASLYLAGLWVIYGLASLRRPA